MVGEPDRARGRADARAGAEMAANGRSQFQLFLRSWMPSGRHQAQYTPLPTEATETDPLQAHASAEHTESAERDRSRSARSSASSMENPSAIEMKRSLSGDVAPPELSGRQPVDTKFKSGGRTVVTAADRDAALSDDTNDGLYDYRLTVTENKLRLIERSLDQMGMGRYQWCIWLLCGFGFFADLAWAQLLGLIAAPIQLELGVADGDIGSVTASAGAD